MKTYLIVYFGSAILAIILTPMVIRLARRFNIVDVPNIRKVHPQPVPRIGGVSIFLSVVFLIIPVLFLPNVIGESFRSVQLKMIVLLSGAGFMFLTGLVDDIKKLSAGVKLFAQLIAAVMICSVGIRIHSVALGQSLVVNFGWFSWPVTIFWIVGITNAVNLIDGLDGLAAGICAAACGVIAILTLLFGPPVMTVLMLCLLGSLSGFLFFNFNPAKIFMGDSGSLFLGFTIASASILCAAKTETVVGLALPVLALGIPIFDTLVSMLRRFLERRSIFAPDRGHFHHRLLALGLRHRHAVIVAYSVTLAAAGLGMFMIFTRNTQTIILFVCILFLLILAFRVVGSVRLNETIAGLKRNRIISNQKKQEMKNFEEVELYFRQAKTFDEWWHAICFAADKMDFIRSSLPLINRDGTKRVLAWGKKGVDIEKQDIVEVTLPVPDRRAGSLLKLGVDVRTNGSVESVGRRIALFGRLIEEYRIGAAEESSCLGWTNYLSE
ncbi:glycosyltransferase family 4 protein [Planctomycetota bacterium]